MPANKAVRVFISYARKDAADLAQTLRDRLERAGLEPWLDTKRIAGGAVWTEEIEQAIDGCDVALALLSPGSYRSDICRAEQLRALRKRKRVIPILAKPGTEIPLHLETKNYRDLTCRPTAAIEQLLQDIRNNRKKSVELKPEFEQTYVTAPPLPRNYLPRPDALEAVRNALLTEDPGPSIALTALKGMGGIGKTVLAQALCHDAVVQQAFPDGIIWITAGKESADDLVTRLREVGKGLKDDLAGYDTQLGSINRYRNILREKAALIVVDDVWSARDIEPFRAESPRSRLLFTTRDGGIADAVGAEQVVAGLLTPEQSRLLLARLREVGRAPDGQRAVSASKDKTLKVWDLEKGHELRTLKGHSDHVIGLSMSPDGRRAVSVSRDKTLKVWDLETGRELRRLDDHSAAVHGVAVSPAPDGLSVVSASWDGTLKVWELGTSRDMRIVNCHTSEVTGVAVIPDGRRAVSASQDKTLQVWDLETGRALRMLRGHCFWVTGVAVTPDGRRAVSASHDNTLKVWDLETGPALCTLQGHSAGVLGAAMAPDGRRAVSASSDNTLKV